MTLITHSGTHMDAPWHYHATMNYLLKPGGEPSTTIDQVPLDWCFRPGVKLDFRHFPDGYVATAKDVDNECARIDYTLKPLDIVLVNTSAASQYDKDDYGTAAAAWAVRRRCASSNRGVRVVGTDSFAGTRLSRVSPSGLLRPATTSLPLGRPQGGTRDRILPDGKAAQPGSPAAVRIYGRMLPGKDQGASAGWTRAVAILEEENEAGHFCRRFRNAADRQRPRRPAKRRGLSLRCRSPVGRVAFGVRLDARAHPWWRKRAHTSRGRGESDSRRASGHGTPAAARHPPARTAAPARADPATFSASSCTTSRRARGR